MRNKHRRSQGQEGFRQRDTRYRGIRCVLSPGQIDPGDSCPQLSCTPNTNPAKIVLKLKKAFFPEAIKQLLHYPSLPAGIALRWFLSGVHAWVSGILRIKRLRSRPTVNLSNLVTKIGKNPLFLFKLHTHLLSPKEWLHLGLAWLVTQNERLGKSLSSLTIVLWVCCWGVYTVFGARLQCSSMNWATSSGGCYWQGAGRAWLLCLGARSRHQHFYVWGYQLAKLQRQEPNGQGRVWRLISKIRSNS